MSLAQAQQAVGSAEFAEWIAFYQLEAELMEGKADPPTSEELGDKLAGWAAAHNARQPAVAKVRR